MTREQAAAARLREWLKSKPVLSGDVRRDIETLLAIADQVVVIERLR